MTVSFNNLRKMVSTDMFVFSQLTYHIKGAPCKLFYSAYISSHITMPPLCGTVAVKPVEENTCPSLRNKIHSFLSSYLFPQMAN